MHSNLQPHNVVMQHNFTPKYRLQNNFDTNWYWGPWPELLLHFATWGHWAGELNDTLLQVKLTRNCRYWHYNRVEKTKLKVGIFWCNIANAPKNPSQCKKSFSWTAGHSPHLARWWWDSVWWHWCCGSIRCRRPRRSSGLGSSCSPPPQWRRIRCPAASDHSDTEERERCAPQTERWTPTCEAPEATWFILSLCDWRSEGKNEQHDHCALFSKIGLMHIWRG